LRLLIIIGAGASYDAYPESVYADDDKIPLANNLFEVQPIQDAFLHDFNLMGLADKIRRAKNNDENFNIESLLEQINNRAMERNEPNMLQSLFAARFYIQKVINRYTDRVIEETSGHTAYVSLLNQLKDWIEESPSDRFVDIVTFNYDSLLELAMKHVFNYDWSRKDPLTGYYAGTNLRLYKPHGSINWGRTIMLNGRSHSYLRAGSIIDDFEKVELVNHFGFVGSASFRDDLAKTYIPAIAVPFGTKTNFDECPSAMLEAMKSAIKEADKVITLGWKGADAHFVSLLKEQNNKPLDFLVVSPSGDTKLKAAYPVENISAIQSGFSALVRGTDFEDILRYIDKPFRDIARAYATRKS
jgi:hypothetical protein